MSQITISTIGLFSLASLFIILYLRRSYANEKIRMSQQIGKMAADSERQSRELRVVSERVASIALQLAVTLDECNRYSDSMIGLSGDMHGNNKKMSESADNSISEIRMMISDIEDLTAKIGTLKNASSYADGTIKGSLQDIRNIVKAVESINETAVNTAKHVEEMHNSSNKIMQILDTVKDISDRTNLLALNAAIESARAGEAGRGFAIVSDEIRKLSGATGEAVDSIGGLVDLIKKQVETLYDVSAANMEKASDGVSAVRIVEKRLGDISASFNETLSSIEEITSISRKQESHTREIESSVERLEKNVIGADGSVVLVHSAVEKQHGEISSLHDMASRLNKSAEKLKEMTTSLNTEIVIDGGIPSKIIESARLSVKGSVLNKILSAPLSAESHMKILSGFMEENPVFDAAWSNDSKGRFICSIPPSGIANAMNREWFKHAIAGEEYISEPYLSAITGEPCVTLSFPLKGKDGLICGVVGFDISKKGQ